MQQGDIVIINFPFTSFEQSKIRPALVISNEYFNNGRNIVLLAISTQEGSALYSYPLLQNSLLEGKLLKKSFIRFSNILSIEKQLIIKKIGKLKKSQFSLVMKKFMRFFNTQQ